MGVGVRMCGCGRGGAARLQRRRVLVLVLAQRWQVRGRLVAQSGLCGRGSGSLAAPRAGRSVIWRGVSAAAAVVVVDVWRFNVHIVRTLGVGQLLFDPGLQFGIYLER